MGARAQARHDGTQPQIQHGAVYLRAPERSDIPLWLTWFNDWRTVRTLARKAPMAGWAEDGWFNSMPEWWGKSDYVFAACLFDGDRNVGNCGLHEIDLPNGNAALGIAIGSPDDQNKGFGTDVVRALLEFGFGQLRLERIWLDVYDGNPGAQRVYEKAGFTVEGVLRHAAFREGAYLDIVRMAILADEWLAAAK